MPDDLIYYADDLKKGRIGVCAIRIDYDVRPLAVEIALVHPYYKYAGMIDCPCTMRAKIGSDDRINAIVDFKKRAQRLLRGKRNTIGDVPGYVECQF